MIKACIGPVIDIQTQPTKYENYKNNLLLNSFHKNKSIVKPCIYDIVLALKLNINIRHGLFIKESKKVTTNLTNQTSNHDNLLGLFISLIPIKYSIFKLKTIKILNLLKTDVNNKKFRNISLVLTSTLLFVKAYIN